LRYHCHLKAETTNTKGYKRRARRQFVWPVCRAYGTGRRASVKDCKVCPLKGGANFSNYAIKWFRFIIFQKQSCLLQASLSADRQACG